MSLARRVRGSGRRLTRDGRGVAGEKRVVFGADASIGTDEGVAEGILRGAGPLGQGGDHDEGRRNRGGSEDHRRVGAGELERH